MYNTRGTKTRCCNSYIKGVRKWLKEKRPQQPQTEVQVDLKKAETIKCDDCGNYLIYHISCD